MRSVAADETFDAWLRLPASDTRTIEEFAEQSVSGPETAGMLSGVYATPFIPRWQRREPATERLLDALGRATVGHVSAFYVSPDVAEELDIERREDVRSGGHVLGDDRGMVFRGIRIVVDSAVAPDTIEVR